MSSQTFDAETVDAIFSERDQLKVENAKLVDVLHEVETEAVYAYHCLQQDCMTTADSSEHFFKKWWHAECELDRLKADSAKLRELASTMWPYIWEAYYSGEMQYKDYATIRDRMQELGIGGSR